jgi:hypothetical protein
MIPAPRKRSIYNLDREVDELRREVKSAKELMDDMILEEGYLDRATFGRLTRHLDQDLNNIKRTREDIDVSMYPSKRRRQEEISNIDRDLASLSAARDLIDLSANQPRLPSSKGQRERKGHRVLKRVRFNPPMELPPFDFHTLQVVPFFPAEPPVEPLSNLNDIIISPAGSPIENPNTAIIPAPINIVEPIFGPPPSSPRPETIIATDPQLTAAVEAVQRDIRDLQPLVDIARQVQRETANAPSGPTETPSQFLHKKGSRSTKPGKETTESKEARERAAIAAAKRAEKAEERHIGRIRGIEPPPRNEALLTILPQRPRENPRPLYKRQAAVLEEVTRPPEYAIEIEPPREREIRELEEYDRSRQYVGKQYAIEIEPPREREIQQPEVVERLIRPPPREPIIFPFGIEEAAPPMENPPGLDELMAELGENEPEVSVEIEAFEGLPAYRNKPLPPIPQYNKPLPPLPQRRLKPPPASPRNFEAELPFSGLPSEEMIQQYGYVRNPFGESTFRNARGVTVDPEVALLRHSKRTAEHALKDASRAAKEAAAAEAEADVGLFIEHTTKSLKRKAEPAFFEAPEINLPAIANRLGIRKARGSHEKKATHGVGVRTRGKKKAIKQASTGRKAGHGVGLGNPHAQASAKRRKLAQKLDDAEKAAAAARAKTIHDEILQAEIDLVCLKQCYIPLANCRAELSLLSFT